MYALQLYHCTKYIPLAHILVIESDQLRDAPDQVVNNVAKFLGLPLLTGQVLGHDGIAEKVKMKYPHMEEGGWNLESQYDVMPEQLEQQMREFFKPYNEMLFEMMGRRFDSWD
ncbi:unnamed protein product [Chrysoparadoxa australica]